MAFEDELRDFMENRLTAFNPAIDLSANSAAQVQIIEPLVARFGEDPFAVDIPTFLRERLVQEFPELAADDAGQLEDVFTKPLQLILEPFKRQIESININQSADNASLMSTDEAEALGANFFQDREEGDFSGGPVRVYFSAPTTIRITPDRQFSSRAGLAYFPTESVFIQSSQMLFNREGSLFFVDVVVRAESTGDSFNVEAGEIISVDDVEGVIKVTNKSAFSSGQPSQTNEEYLGDLPEALTERSLVTNRGILTRVPDTFGSSVRAIQIVGAGEDGMNRDILKGTGEGFLHIVGNCSFFGNWIILGSVLYRDDGPDDNIVIQAGDTVRLILSIGDDVTRTVYSATISDLISVSVGTATEKHILILDTTLDTLIGSSSAGAVGTPVVSVFKKGFITISERPGGISESQAVPTDSVHLGGHNDVFVRPSADVEQESVLPNLTDGSPLLALLDFVTTSGSNRISSATNFVAAGVKAGDALVLEAGTSAGTYKILSVGTPDADTQIRVDAIVDAGETELRGRIFRKIAIDLVEPKVGKVPFTSTPVNDLRTSVGSTLFRLDDTDIQSFGAAAGDTIRVFEGPNAGDYVIKSFDPILGGQGPIVDVAAPATSTGSRYEVFTVSEGLEFPLVRIKRLEILDSTNQGTGITVPYGDAVDIRPLCSLEGASSTVRVLTKDIMVYPDAVDLWLSDGTGLTETFASTTAHDEDARYSKGIAIADGRVRTATTQGTIEAVELNFPPFLYNGRRDVIRANVTREDPNFAGTLPAGQTHQTSDIAESKIGDSIVILDGPNAGSYTIQDLRVFDLWQTGHRKIALVQLDRELAVDPIKTVLDYIDDAGVVAVSTADDYASGLETTSYLQGIFWTNHVVGRLVTTINDPSQLGPGTITTEEADELMRGLAASGYEIGSSATGTLRTYFQEPVSLEFNFGEDPTFFQVVGQPEQLYRIDQSIGAAQIFPQAIAEEPVADWNRDLVMQMVDRTKMYLGSGSSFVERGIQDGDRIEYYRPHNDRPSRINMKSSWMFVTKAGSNVVRAIFPTGGGGYDPIDNSINIEEGHLFFIDSGPDTGSYVITEVISTDFSTDPVNVQFKVDRIMTHSTDVFPGDYDDGFDSDARAVVSAPSDFIFPLTFTGGEQFEVISGGLHPDEMSGSTKTFTFPAITYNNIGELVDALNADAGFIGTNPNEEFFALADGDKLVLRSTTYKFGGHLSIEAVPIPSAGSFTMTDDQSDGWRKWATCVVGTKRIYGTGLDFANPYLWAVDQWVSIYAASENQLHSSDDVVVVPGEDEKFLGTYKVVSVGTETDGPMNGLPFVEIDRDEDFDTVVELLWLRHTEPTTTPSSTTGGGKDLSQNYVRGRLYRESPETTLVSIPWDTAAYNPLLGIDDLVNPIEPDQLRSADDLLEAFAVTDFNYGHKMPYRIIRDDIFKISSTEMSLNRDNALYYVDIPVIGLGTNDAMNIDVDVGLQLEGNYKIDGYTLEVANEIFVFSEEEQVSIILPTNVLPVGSTPELDNRASLAGQNLQINYDNADLISNIQSFFSSPLDRVVVANALVRHFLPSYVYLDVTYSGGASEADIATELISYINNIDPDLNEISADEVANIVRKQGATNVQHPVRLIILTHGTDRRIRGTQSTNIVGGSNLPTFSGTFKQTYFIAGPDTSNEEVRPDGEQVFLDQL